jgi:hypothetical protein
MPSQIRNCFAFIAIYTADDELPYSPIFKAQNFSDAALDISNLGYGMVDYASFAVSEMGGAKDELSNTATVTFPGTVEYINVIKDCIDNGRFVELLILRSDPLTVGGSYNVFGEFAGNVLGAETDFISITASIGHPSTSSEANLPWRKVSSNIIGPVLAG